MFFQTTCEKKVKSQLIKYGFTISSKASSTLLQSIASSEKVKAEIRWAVKSVMSNFSNSSCNDVSTLFKTMFPDSSIASNFAISEDKIRYMINYGIATYFKGLLIDEIKKSLCHSISFDESTNSKTQECQLDLVIRFCDEVNNQVTNRYLGFRFYWSFCCC